MPARIVDELDDQGNAPQPGDLSAAIAPAAAAPTPAPDTGLTGDDVPDKYRGKTAAELLEIVTNQESMIGRQGHELGDLRTQNGTLRGLVDQSLALRDPGAVGREGMHEDDLSDDDFLTSPRDAVTRTVQRETQETTERLAQLENQAAAIDFAGRHPTAAKDINDPNFVDFVKKSTVRSRLAATAFADEANVDYEAASELWELYEDYQTMVPAPAAGETETPAVTPVVASPEPGNDPPTMVTGTSQASGDASGKPIYSQAALNRLQATNPDLYWANDTQAKLTVARQEGRVLQDDLQPQ